MNVLAVLLLAAAAAWASPPKDFDRFWSSTLRELAAEPVELRLEPVAAQSDAGVLCFKARYRGLESRPIHAWYCRPAPEGRYPAILLSPWYGLGAVLPPRDVAGRGFAVLSYQGRGFEVDLSTYPAENASYILSGIESPRSYAYRWMFGAAVRGIDVLAGRPEVDASRIGAGGASQGGALSLVAAALDRRVAAVSADFPSLCDIPSTMKVSEGSLGEVRRHLESHPGRRKETQALLAYFDVLHFAPKIRVPARIQAGLLDRSCPPDGIKAVFRAIPGRPKILEVFPNAGHGDENAARWDKMLGFLFERLKKA